MAVIIGVTLAIGKWFVWQESHSVGILSSLVHSGLDLFGAQVCLIVMGAAHLIEEVLHRMSHSHELQQGGFAIAMSWAIRATGSIAVRGDRAHYLADLFANIFVILGLALSTYTSFIWADALVGGLMALWLLWTAFKIARLAWSQLMDQELNDQERALITKLALQDPKVKSGFG